MCIFNCVIGFYVFKRLQRSFYILKNRRKQIHLLNQLCNTLLNIIIMILIMMN